MRGTSGLTDRVGAVGPRQARRALIVHGSFETLGGAEVYSARVISILQDIFDEIVVLHYGKSPTLAAFYLYAKIPLSPSVVKFRSIDVRGLALPRPQFFGEFVLLRYARVVRHARKIAHNFELIVSTFAECPLNVNHMVQCIQIPIFVSDKESLEYCGVRYNNYLRRLAHGAYVSTLKIWMGFSRAGMKAPVTIANSRWSANQVLRHYPAANVRAEYFGVEISLTPTSPDWKPFAERKDNFVLLGRVVPSKRVEDAVEILERVRAQGHLVGLIIIGAAPPSFSRTVADLITDKPWISWKENLDRGELERTIVNQKWGLHCYRFEHYGFAPAELQALGCITFVHDSGGQREIVQRPGQRYDSVDDAVDKILALLESDELRAEALRSGAASTAKHRTDVFERRFRALVADVLRR